MNPGNPMALELSAVVKNAVPVQRGVFLLARLIAAMLLTAIVWIALMLVSATVGKIVVELAQWTGLLIMALARGVTFGGLGALTGALSVLPHSFAQFALAWPAYDPAQLAREVVGAGGVDFVLDLVELVGMTVLFFALIRRAPAKVR